MQALGLSLQGTGGASKRSSLVLFNIINKSPGVELKLTHLSSCQCRWSCQVHRNTSLHNLAGLIKFEFVGLIHSIQMWCEVAVIADFCE